MPTKGTAKILAIAIDFPDYPSTLSIDEIRDGLFDNSHSEDRPGYPFDSVHNFYWRASYGKLNITGDVLGWYHCPTPRADRRPAATGDPERDQTNNIVAAQWIIAEALAYYDSQGVDFSQYDVDGNGTIDSLIVMWSGPFDDWGELWWPYQYYYYQDLGPDVTYDGVEPYVYVWQGEVFPDSQENGFDCTTAIHETGHALGLPDLYDYTPYQGDGPENGVGSFDVMDNPVCDMNGFFKWLLGWTTPTIVGNGSEELWQSPTSQSEDQGLVVWPGAEFGSNVPFSELYYVENRQPVGNDLNMETNQDTGSGGVAVWHVDARLGDDGYFACDNSACEHNFIELVEAPLARNGIREQGRYSWRSFYYPGQSIDDSTRPSTESVEGYGTGISIEVLDASGTDMLVTYAIEDSAGWPDTFTPGEWKDAGEQSSSRAPMIQLARQGKPRSALSLQLPFALSASGLRWSRGPSATPPATLTASVLESGAVALSWTQIGGAAEYRLERALAPLGPYSEIADVEENMYVDRARSGVRYYYRVKALVGGAESGTSNVVAAETPSLGTTTVEAENADVSFGGTWERAEDEAHSNGQAMSARDASATIEFRGSALRLLGAVGPDSGTIEIALDGEPYPVAIDLLRQDASYQQELFRATGLADGPHTLTLTAQGDGVVTLDALQITGMNPGLCWEEDAAEYDGSFEVMADEADSGGGAIASETGDSSATFTFEGASVSWLGTRSGTSGQAEVYVDGASQGVIDLYSPIVVNQSVIFCASGLERGKHTLKIVPAGTKSDASSGTTVEVDAFVVR
jgi:M6 family metalloprotease-like protein